MATSQQYALDPVTGQLVVGDVGENVREELDILRTPGFVTLRPGPALQPAEPPGANLGWPYLEGSAPGAHRFDCAPAPAGRYRFVVTTCQRCLSPTRFESAPFTLPAPPP